MAKNIVVLPTCDIHLLPISGLSMQLTVLWFDPPKPPIDVTHDINPPVHTRYEDFDLGLVIVDPGLVTVQNPPSLGVTIGRVIHSDGIVDDHEVQVRIQVHDSIDRLWFGNQHATIHKTQSNYVLTVYAIFSDGTVGDVTAHPFLEFESLDPSVVTVNSEGRLTGINPGATVVVVRHGSHEDSVAVQVQDSLSTPRNILKRLHPSDAKLDERPNFLILAEGFTNEQEFDELALRIREGLTTSPWASPFNRLRESYNIWTAFEKSYEDGISVGPEVKKSSDTTSWLLAGTPLLPEPTRTRLEPNPGNYTLGILVQMVGFPHSASPGNLEAARGLWSGTAPAGPPVLELDGVTPFKPNRLEPKIFQAWLEMQERHPLQAKDSFFGLIYGARRGDRDSVGAHLTRPTLWYLPPKAHREIFWDRRRLASNLDFQKFFETYLKSLSLDNQEVGSRWLLGGPDQGLVGILVNDAVHGGDSFQESFLTEGGTVLRFRVFTVSKGKNQNFTLRARPQGIDHDPAVARVNLVHVVDNFSHEFSHIILGDEYHADHEGESRLRPDNPNHQEAARGITLFSNLTHIGVVGSTTTPEAIDPGRIKWGKWHRIAMADSLAAPAANVGSPISGEIEIRLRTRQGQRWKALEGSVTQRVFLRNKDLNENRPHSTARLLGPLSVVSASANGDTLVLSGGNVSGPDDFPQGSTLYLPLLGSPTLIHSNVMQHLASTGRPFSHSTNCAAFVSNGSSGEPDPDIANFIYPSNRYEVIGIYQGGGGFNCGVYRPAGMCRMRSYDRQAPRGDTKRTKFCFVCQYALVNELDPAQHEHINNEYP
jgi:hypothetical protein